MEPGGLMARTRDDFPMSTKRRLAERVGMRCSNPNCRCLTSGPTQVGNGSVNIGVAAHITAASKGGPRFDPGLNSEGRKGIENAIWLCQNCAALIDRDIKRYDADLLRAWRENSEEAARLDVGAIRIPGPGDREILQFFAMCLDRPAFIDRFHQERSVEAFDKAIKDTITAFNTGSLRSRDGVVLQLGVGKSYLTDPKIRAQITTFVTILRAMRARYTEAKRAGQISVWPHGHGHEGYVVHEAALADWFDATRMEALSIFAAAAESAGVSYHLPTQDWAEANWVARNTRLR